ncbi:MAG: dTMP kinase [Pseudomonadota bacterium]
MTRGKLITIEGVEGVGKTTNISVVQQLLTESGLSCLVTREPGGTALAESIRLLLLDRDETTMDSITELLLVFAARSHHVNALIRPALAAGHWVICDRFTDSTYAYQGGGRGIDESVIREIETLALGGFEPDLTLLLDLPVATGMARATARAEQDRFESEDVAFFERVRQVFLRRAAEIPRFRVIEANAAADLVAARVRDAVMPLLPGSKI